MAEILLCSADHENIRFVASALEQIGHTVDVESSRVISLSALALAHYDAVVIDLASLEMPEGEVLKAARSLQGRAQPGLLVLGIRSDKLPKVIRQSRIMVLPAPFVPSQIVEALGPLVRVNPAHSSLIDKLARHS